MILADTHIHTNYSSDSSESMENMVQRGIHLGLKELYFTDHMDLDFPKKYKFDFLFDVQKQQNEIKQLQNKYMDKITIYRGIELGLQPHLLDEVDSLLSKYYFDYVIGSVHVVDNLDPYYGEYWDQFKTESDGIVHYFETALNCLESLSHFDSFGHLDYVIRYAPSGATDYSYQKYSEIIDAILTKLITMQKTLEINSSGYRKNGASNPNFDIVKRYFELGGTDITIGSDAHESNYLAQDFKKIEIECKKIGLDHYTVFHDHKPIHLSFI